MRRCPIETRLSSVVSWILCSWFLDLVFNFALKRKTLQISFSEQKETLNVKVHILQWMRSLLTTTTRYFAHLFILPILSEVINELVQ